MKLSPLLLAAAAAGLFAAPAAAQHPDERSRTGRVAGEIARTIEDTAEAIGTVTDAVRNSVDGVRYRSAERHAIDRCAPRVARFGRMRVAEVQPHGRRSLRVHGTTDGHAAYGYSRSSPRAFTCTVRDDGRVKLRTRRLA
jgi:hypothetical protein